MKLDNFQRKETQLVNRRTENSMWVIASKTGCNSFVLWGLMLDIVTREYSTIALLKTTYILHKFKTCFSLQGNVWSWSV